MDPLPIVFKVPSEELADEILRYRDTIRDVAQGDSALSRVALVYALPVGDDILQEYIRNSIGHGLYPVVYGRECAVFLS